MNSAPNKKKLYFNFIDVLLIVVLLISMASLIYFLRERRIVTDPRGKTAEIVYKVEVPAMREEFRNLVAIGDSVVDTVTMNAIGEVTDVSYAPYLYVGTDRTTGLKITTSYPGKISMTMTIKVLATITDTGYTVGGQPLILGKTISLRVPDWAGSGQCVSIETITTSQGKTEGR